MAGRPPKPLFVTGRQRVRSAGPSRPPRSRPRDRNYFMAGAFLSSVKGPCLEQTDDGPIRPARRLSSEMHGACCSATPRLDCGRNRSFTLPCTMGKKHRSCLAGTGSGSRQLPAAQLVERQMTIRSIVPGVTAGALILALAACTNPYDPGQRAVGGGLLGAGAGAAIGGAVGGGHGAALGAAIGGATGALGGAATTPPPPPPPPAYGYGRPSYGYGYPPPPPPAYPPSY